MINRAAFFPKVRSTLFANYLLPTQFQGLNLLLDTFEALYPTAPDYRWLAYELGTVYWETAKTMQPIAEWGKGMHRPYGVPDRVTGKTYYGRGFVQLTWKANYLAMSSITGLDLVTDPDLAMRPDVAVRILHYGMAHGSFTGKKLSDYFNDKMFDPFNARRIINGVDHAGDIATISGEFHEAMLTA